MSNEERLTFNRHLIALSIFVALVSTALTAIVCAVISIHIAKNKQYTCAIATEQEIVELEEIVIEELPQINEKIVTFTNYYPNDATRSTTRTGSGLTINDFEVNSKGWYTWNGKVVIASATYECMYSKYGACAKYNSLDDLPLDYDIYHYFDEFVFSVDNEEYEAIVLDSCSASWWDREQQTYDIFIQDGTKAFGKIKGVIYE